jgi:hypothetical protein
MWLWLVAKWPRMIFMGACPFKTGRLMISSIILPPGFISKKEGVCIAGNKGVLLRQKQTLSLDYTTEGAQNASGFQK